MWPLTRINHEIVSVAFAPASITCSAITTRKSTFELIAFEHIQLDNQELVDLIPFNPTALTMHIRSFLTNHHLEHAWTLFALSDPGIAQTIVPMPTATPHKKDFRFPKLKSLIWDFRYLHPMEENLSAFYVCGISPQLLMYYKLLALQLPAHLVAITPESSAHQRLYRHVQGAAFRPAQLARDMERTNNQLTRIFTPELIRRCMAIPIGLNVAIEKNRTMLATALGLHLVGNDLK